MTKVSSLGRLGAPMLLRDYVAANLVIFLTSSQEDFVRLARKDAWTRFLVITSWVMQRGQMRSR